MATASARRALVLFAHGARDPRWAQPFQRLQQLIQAQSPTVKVELAFLECMTPSLPDCVQQMVLAGHAEITVVPVFLGQGGHVLRDLPLMLDQLRQTYPELRLNVAPAAGEDRDVLNAIAQYCIGTLTVL
jgi:sirohydrochlorin cobaltochelatase